MWVVITVSFTLNFWLGGLGIVLVLFRIYRLKIKGLVVFNLILAIIPCLMLLIFNHDVSIKQHNLELQTNKNQTFQLDVLPDQIHVNEDKFTGVVYLPQLRQKVILFGFCKDDSERALIKNIDNKKRLTVQGDLSKIDDAPNVNQFSSQTFYGDQKIYGQIKSSRLLQSKAISNRSFDWLHQIRYWGIKSTEGLPKTLKLYVLSLVFGYKNAEFKDEMAGIKQLGIIHLFSISGMHVYFLIDLLLMITSYLFIKKEYVEWGLILGLPGYFIVAGSSVGLLRAVLMIEERLLSKKVSVYFTRLDIWSFALMINLLINPLMIHQFGCQLSYCLSFALIYTGKLNQFRTSVVLDLVSLSIILFYLYEWHSLSVLANLLIIPFFGTFIFPLVLVAYGSSLITNRLTQVAELILNNFDKYLNSISELPGKIVFGKPSVLLIVIFIVVSLLLIEKFDWKKCVLIFVTLMCMYVQIHFPRSGEVTFFDVGQGDSFLLREPFNKSVTIIDTGGKPNFFASQGQKDVYLAPNTSIRYLKSIGISRIDNLCLSHQDADHLDIYNYYCC